MKVLLIVPDNGSYISTFPLGIAYIASILRQRGDDVQIYSKDVYHYSESDLTQYLDGHDFDIVGTGTCGGYWQYREMKSIARAVRASKKRHIFIAGGTWSHRSRNTSFAS